jgi:hypothetical protein
MKEFSKIETWEDICEALNIDPVKSLAWVDHLEEEDKKPQAALFKINKLRKLSWGDEIPSFANGNQEKWFPVFNGRSGFGFSDTGYDVTDTYVGARLSYKTEEDSDHAATQFIEWYEDLMVIPEE